MYQMKKKVVCYYVISVDLSVNVYVVHLCEQVNDIYDKKVVLAKQCLKPALRGNFSFFIHFSLNVVIILT